MNILKLFRKQKTVDVQPQKTYNILIAEDDTYLNDFYVELLTAEGYKVTSVVNGQQALDSIAENPPDLAILDINMPMVNGDDVLAHIRKESKTKDLPVIILTNAGSVENITYTRVHHANRFFTKSDIEPPKLLEAVRTILIQKTI